MVAFVSQLLALVGTATLPPDIPLTEAPVHPSPPVVPAGPSRGVDRAAWLDLGLPDDHTGPVAVIVPQPGLRPLAYTALVAHLEAQGFDAGLVVLPTAPADLVDHTLPAVFASLAPRSVVVIGHGYGGRALLASAELSASSCAVALLGVPLVVRPTPWQAALAQQPVPPDGLDLRAARRTADPRAPWPLVRTTDGFPTAWLGRVGAEWLALMHTAPGAPLAPPTTTPTWVGTAPLDALAPPETLGPLGPDVRVTRWGMLRGWRTDATSATLLHDPRPAADLARWAHRSCA